MISVKSHRMKKWLKALGLEHKTFISLFNLTPDLSVICNILVSIIANAWLKMYLKPNECLYCKVI